MHKGLTHDTANNLAGSWPSFALAIRPAGAAQTDVNEETEKAMKAAAAKVAPSVVRIETSGGQDIIVWTDRADRGADSQSRRPDHRPGR